MWVSLLVNSTFGHISAFFSAVTILNLQSCLQQFTYQLHVIHSSSLLRLFNLQVHQVFYTCRSHKGNMLTPIADSGFNIQNWVSNAASLDMLACCGIALQQVTSAFKIYTFNVVLSDLHNQWLRIYRFPAGVPDKNQKSFVETGYAVQ